MRGIYVTACHIKSVLKKKKKAKGYFKTFFFAISN